MPTSAPHQGIYSATYSNVPVYEYSVAGNHVMRRRSDDWINATHILKVADFDKPARTRILEREVQKNVHEKVQGGYGKYQGTWIPLPDGRNLAERNGVLQKLLPIFDYVPGDSSPPPAPKHATASSAKPRGPRASAATRRKAAPSQRSEEVYEDASARFDDTPDNVSMVSDSAMEEQDPLRNSQYSEGGRKRKRGADQISVQDQQHQIWADHLLDYFMLLESPDSFPAPEPPPTINLDRAIDDKGHSAMHWAAAMGDIDIVTDLIRRGARIDCLSEKLETPLMRGVMFTNNYDKKNMPAMFNILQPTVVATDRFGSTVFHHIAATTLSKSKYEMALYYLECMLDSLAESWNSKDIAELLNLPDKNGDTAVLLAAKNGARRSVGALMRRGVALDIPNHRGETAEDFILILNQRRRDGRRRDASSSPVGPDSRSRMNGSGTAPYPASLADALADAAAARGATYKSQTAAALMTKVAPTLVEKFATLAAAYENELLEKEAELAECERVVGKRQAEHDALSMQISEMLNSDDPLLSKMAKVGFADQESGGIDPEIVRVDGELAAEEGQQELQLHEMVAQVERQVDDDSRRELAEMMIRSEEQVGARPRSETDPAVSVELDGQGGFIVDGMPLSYEEVRAEVQEHLDLQKSIREAERTRRHLVKEIVQHMAVAGVNERMNEYKRLISLALDLRGDEVEGLLPDILAELEEEKRRNLLER